MILGGAATARPRRAAEAGGLDATASIWSNRGSSLLAPTPALKRARLFIGNNSGLMQLAAAAGAPTLGLFGPSDERLYGPWGPTRAASLRGPRDFDAIPAAGPRPRTRLSAT